MSKEKNRENCYFCNTKLKFCTVCKYDYCEKCSSGHLKHDKENEVKVGNIKPSFRFTIPEKLISFEDSLDIKETDGFVINSNVKLPKFSNLSEEKQMNYYNEAWKNAEVSAKSEIQYDISDLNKFDGLDCIVCHKPAERTLTLEGVNNWETVKVDFCKSHAPSSQQLHEGFTDNVINPTNCLNSKCQKELPTAFMEILIHYASKRIVGIRFCDFKCISEYYNYGSINDKKILKLS